MNGKWLYLILIPVILLAGCADPQPQGRAVYLLMDTSGTYTRQLEKARAIINYLLVTLDSGDSLAVARIDSGSFSEKDIIARATFDQRPSTASNQKRLFRSRIDDFIASVKPSSHTDISGAALQAVEYLNETGAGKKTILIFSDLEEDLAQGQVRDFDLPLEGIEVVAINVTKLRSDNIDPRKYLSRLAEWQRRVLTGGGSWRVINDLEHLEKIFVG